ncbi:hypothetical protein PO909_032603 [Leuciscus waleckii]
MGSASALIGPCTIFSVLGEDWKLKLVTAKRNMMPMSVMHHWRRATLKARIRRDGPVPASLDPPVVEEEELPLEVSSEDIDLVMLVSETPPVTKIRLSRSHQISTLRPLIHSPWNSDSPHLHIIINTHYKEALLLHFLVWSRPYMHLQTLLVYLPIPTYLKDSSSGLRLRSSTIRLLSSVSCLQPAESSSITCNQDIKINSPETFTGEAEDCSGFLLKCSLYFEMQSHQFATDRARVAFVISLLSGHTLQWAQSPWQSNTSLSAFFSHFKEVFGQTTSDL